MAVDLNETFAQAFAEALAPVMQALRDMNERLGALEEDRGYEEEPDVPLPADTVWCNATPPSDDLFPGQSWTACDLPADHEGPHNVGLRDA